MRPLALSAIPLLLAAVAQPAAAAPCAPRPMPPALDSLPPTAASSSIGFSATPWEFPGRAWAVRASRRGQGDAALEILRLLRQSDCNRWRVEARWTAPLPAAEYRALAEAVAPLARPPAGLFSTDGGSEADEIVTDGTAIAVRLHMPGWTAARELNHYGRSGARVSALFHALVARHVPAAERPAADWRTRRGR